MFKNLKSNRSTIFFIILFLLVSALVAVFIQQQTSSSSPSTQNSNQQQQIQQQENPNPKSSVFEIPSENKNNNNVDERKQEETKISTSSTTTKISTEQPQQNQKTEISSPSSSCSCSCPSNRFVERYFTTNPITLALQAFAWKQEEKSLEIEAEKKTAFDRVFSQKTKNIKTTGSGIPTAFKEFLKNFADIDEDADKFYGGAKAVETLEKQCGWNGVEAKFEKDPKCLEKLLSGKTNSNNNKKSSSSSSDNDEINFDVDDDVALAENAPKLLDIVVPTIRDLDFLEHWREFIEPFHIILIQDGDPSKYIKIPPWVDYELYNRNDIDSILGKDKSWIISSKDASIRNFGFLITKKKYVYTLDDDCFPVTTELLQQHLSSSLDTQHHERNSGGFCSTLNPQHLIQGPNPILQHLRNLLKPSAPFFFNTLYDGFKSGSDFVRGYPFSMRDGHSVSPTVVSHGLWLNVPDYDAPTQLLKPKERNKNLANDVIINIPAGVLFPLCSMNVAFDREKIGPAFMQGLMGVGQPWARYDDMFAGWASKTVADHLAFGVKSGAPYIFHNKASNPFTNLKKEYKGLWWQEVVIAFFNRVQIPTNCTDAKSSYRSLAYSIRSELLPLHPYFGRLSDAMLGWVDAWENSERGILKFIPSRKSNVMEVRLSRAIFYENFGRPDRSENENSNENKNNNFLGSDSSSKTTEDETTTNYKKRENEKRKRKKDFNNRIEANELVVRFSKNRVNVTDQEEELGLISNYSSENLSSDDTNSSFSNNFKKRRSSLGAPTIPASPISVISNIQEEGSGKETSTKYKKENEKNERVVEGIRKPEGCQTFIKRYENCLKILRSQPNLENRREYFSRVGVSNSNNMMKSKNNKKQQTKSSSSIQRKEVALLKFDKTFWMINNGIESDQNKYYQQQQHQQQNNNLNFLTHSDAKKKWRKKEFWLHVCSFIIESASSSNSDVETNANNNNGRDVFILVPDSLFDFDDEMNLQQQNENENNNNEFSENDFDDEGDNNDNKKQNFDGDDDNSNTNTFPLPFDTEKSQQQQKLSLSNSNFLSTIPYEFRSLVKTYSEDSLRQQYRSPRHQFYYSSSAATTTNKNKSSSSTTNININLQAKTPFFMDGTYRNDLVALNFLRLHPLYNFVWIVNGNSRFVGTAASFQKQKQNQKRGRGWGDLFDESRILGRETTKIKTQKQKQQNSDSSDYYFERIRKFVPFDYQPVLVDDSFGSSYYNKNNNNTKSKASSPSTTQTTKTNQEEETKSSISSSILIHDKKNKKNKKKQQFSKNFKKLRQFIIKNRNLSPLESSEDAHLIFLGHAPIFQKSGYFNNNLTTKQYQWHFSKRKHFLGNWKILLEKKSWIGSFSPVLGISRLLLEIVDFEATKFFRGHVSHEVSLPVAAQLYRMKIFPLFFENSKIISKKEHEKDEKEEDEEDVRRSRGMMKNGLSSQIYLPWKQTDKKLETSPLYLSWEKNVPIDIEMNGVFSQGCEKHHGLNCLENFLAFPVRV